MWGEKTFVYLLFQQSFVPIRLFEEKFYHLKEVSFMPSSNQEIYDLERHYLNFLKIRTNMS